MNGKLICDETNKTNISHPKNSSEEFPEYSAIKYRLSKMRENYITSFYILYLLLLVFKK